MFRVLLSFMRYDRRRKHGKRLRKPASEEGTLGTATVLEVVYV